MNASAARLHSREVQQIGVVENVVGRECGFNSDALMFHRGSTAAQIRWPVWRRWALYCCVPCLAWLHGAGMRRRLLTALYWIGRVLLSERARFRCAWLDAVRNEVTRQRGRRAHVIYVGGQPRSRGCGHLGLLSLAEIWILKISWFRMGWRGRISSWACRRH
jgi:hypothetical protein